MKPLPELARLDKARVDKIAADKGVTRQMMADVFDDDATFTHALQGCGVRTDALPALAELLGVELAEILATPGNAAANAKGSARTARPNEWTPEEDRILAEYAHEGLAAVTKRLEGRNESAVQNRAARRGLSLRRTGLAAEEPTEAQAEQAPEKAAETPQEPEGEQVLAVEPPAPEDGPPSERETVILGLIEETSDPEPLLAIALDDLLNERVAALHRVLDTHVHDSAAAEIKSIVGRIVDAAERRARL